VSRSRREKRERESGLIREKRLERDRCLRWKGSTPADEWHRERGAPHDLLRSCKKRERASFRLCQVATKTPSLPQASRVCGEARPVSFLPPAGTSVRFISTMHARKRSLRVEKGGWHGSTPTSPLEETSPVKLVTWTNRSRLGREKGKKH